jgi:fibronectin type 3 domain-containing protein
LRDTGVRLRSQASKGRISLLSFLIPLFILWAGCGRKGPPVSLDRIVPEATTDLEASVRGGRVILEWSLPKENTDGSKLVDLQGFTVLRGSFEGEECRGCPERLAPIAEVDLASGERYVIGTNRVFWVDKGFRAGRTYGYRVLAFNRRGHFSGGSNKVEVLWDVPPPAPKHVRAVTGDGMVELKWAPVEEAVGYNLYRGKGEKDFPLHPLNPDPIEDTHYRDTQVVNDRNYRYAVRSVSKAGETLIEGRGSTTITMTPVDLIPPSPPTGLVAFPLPQGMELTWTANPEPDVVGYRVYRRRVFEPKFERLTDETVRETVYLDGGVRRGEEYDYGVTAIDGSRDQNESAFSEMIRVKYTYIE